METTLGAPTILIGHSLGGAPVLAAAEKIPEAKAVVVIGAPADPEHVSHLFKTQLEEIETQVEATVNLAGRSFKIKKQFLDDISGQNLHTQIGRMKKTLLIFHSPHDEIVDIDNARRIFDAGQAPEELHLARRRRSSSKPQARLAVRGRHHRGMGTSLPARGAATHRHRGDGLRSIAVRCSCEKTMGSLGRTFLPDPITCWPMNP